MYALVSCSQEASMNTTQVDSSRAYTCAAGINPLNPWMPFDYKRPEQPAKGKQANKQTNNSIPHLPWADAAFIDSKLGDDSTCSKAVLVAHEAMPELLAQHTKGLEQGVDGLMTVAGIILGPLVRP